MKAYRFTAVALAVAALFVFADAASAAKKKGKKLTYDQAWQKCQVEVNKLPGDQHSARMARGSACMKSLGYRI
jgi:hypothetical protein